MELQFTKKYSLLDNNGDEVGFQTLPELLERICIAASHWLPEMEGVNDAISRLTDNDKIRWLVGLCLLDGDGGEIYKIFPQREEIIWEDVMTK